MSTTTTTTSTAPVIPLQRNEAPSTRRRHTVDRSLPSVADHAWWDAEAEAKWCPPRPHGRRCACCRPALAAAIEVA